MNWLAGLFLVADGFIHVAVWCIPSDEKKAAFDPKHSWLAKTQRSRKFARPIAVVLAVAAGLIFVVAGAGVIAEAGWAAAWAGLGALLSLGLTAAYFHSWLSFNLLIDAAILLLAIR